MANTFRTLPNRWSRTGPEARAIEEALQESCLLEAAHFFDPGLRAARERAVALRKLASGGTTPRATKN
jgi:hypothetical protein